MVKDHTDTWATLSDWQQGIFYMHHPTDRIVHTMASVNHCGALAETSNSLVGPPWGIDPMIQHHGGTSRSLNTEVTIKETLLNLLFS